MERSGEVQPATTVAIEPMAGENRSHLAHKIRVHDPCCDTWLHRVELGVDSVFFHGDEATDDFASSGRVWFGLQLNPVYSVRNRVWLQEYDFAGRDVTDSIINTAPPTGTAFAFAQTRETKASSFDLELRRTAQFRRVQLESFVGTTYAEFDNKASFVGSFVDLDVDEFRHFSDSVESRFEGIGLNFGFDSVIPFRNVPFFGLVANLRGAVLGGNNQSFLQNNVRSFTAGPGNQLELASVDSFAVPGSGGGTIFVGHAQLGVQFSKPIRCFGCGTFITRGLFEFQTWNQEDVTFFHPSMGPSTADFDRELIGFSFGVGLER